MFMEPDTVPAYFPPISMHAAHDGGMARSLQKLANPMVSMAAMGDFICTASSSSNAAPANPAQASKRRLVVTLPTERATHGEISPQNAHPRPPRNSGSTAMV